MNIHKIELITGFNFINLKHKISIIFSMFSVLWKPVFTRHPQDTSVHFYDSAAIVTLKCAVDGFPRPVISWLENNSTVINETVTQNGSVSSLALVFHKIREQALTYGCVARNSVGTTLSKEATLTFPETPMQSHRQGRLKERHTVKFLFCSIHTLLSNR